MGGFVRWKDNGYIIDIKIFTTSGDSYDLLPHNSGVTNNGDLILSDRFHNNITFENITLQAGSNTAAYIVKYHDPSILTPFIGGDILNDTFRPSQVATRNADTIFEAITLNGEVLSFGNPRTTEVGFIYGTDSTALTLNNTNATKVNVDFTFSTTTYNKVLVANNFQFDVTYYYRSFITNDYTQYGAVKSFSRATSGLEKVNDVSALISVFPNPATNELNIVSPVAIKQVEVLNLLGRVVYEQKVNAASVKVDVSALAKGNYFVKIYTDKGVVVRKITIQ